VAPNGDAEGVVGDPLFVDPAGAALGFRIGAGSPAIDAGLDIADNGGRDYAGTKLYSGAVDIGALEYTTGDCN
jgi:hypothetical protein